MANTAALNYITNLAKYLKQPGTPPDLTIKFGAKVYKIHRLLACAQSEWFSKAVNGGFKEGQTGVITLEDDPEFGAAISCMMEFFYDAKYSVPSGPPEILYAQICVIGDKYMCQALFDYAEASFRQILRNPTYKLTADWVKLGSLVYDYLSTDLPSHVKMRKSVVWPVDQHGLDKMALKIPDFIKDHPLAAVDVLFKGQGGSNKPVSHHLFKCPHCTYAHVGTENCSFLSSVYAGISAVCPNCRSSLSLQVHGLKSAKFRLSVRCDACGGMHTG